MQAKEEESKRRDTGSMSEEELTSGRMDIHKR